MGYYWKTLLALLTSALLLCACGSPAAEGTPQIDPDNCVTERGTEGCELHMYCHAPNANPNGQLCTQPACVQWGVEWCCAASVRSPAP